MIRHEGTEESIRGLANYLRVKRPDLRWRFDNSRAPVWALEVEYKKVDGNNNTPPPVWELIGQDSHRDIIEHPTTTYLAAKDLKLYRYTLQVIRTILDARGITMDKTWNQFDFSEYDQKLVPTALALIKLYTEEHRTYSRGQYVLRKTQVVSQESEIRLAFNQIDCIWITDLLVTKESIPPETLFSIKEIEVPAYVVSPIEGNPLAFYWGWLKKTPSAVKTTSGRFQISQEWWLSLWNNYAYRVAQ